ncbi:MAG: fumarate hydratase [Clostridia bacterium]|nr:fumarate hydratase [Clostridia bacterium]
MRTISSKEIENAVYSLALKACVSLTDDCAAALRSAREKESSLSCAYALDLIAENAEIAKQRHIAVCQDTGLAVVWIEIGNEVFVSGDTIGDAVNEGVRRAYRDGYFRKSVCDPLTRANTGDNTPAFWHIEIVKGDKVDISFLPKGFGSENMSRIYMLTPAEGREGIIDCIVKTVEEAGSRPCPPVIVGVGIGGTFDGCALLAKKALFRHIGSLNPRKEVAEIEQEALKKINALGIGCQGFGGKVTALGVICEVMPTHIAGLPVAVNIQCHALRRERAVL